MPPRLASPRSFLRGGRLRGLWLAAALAGSATLRGSPAELRALQARADRGEAAALAALGTAYADGRDLPVDYAKAMGYFRQAAAAGSALAEYNLGLMCEAGRGTAPDPKQAFAHYFRAAGLGLPQAEFNVGNMYASGRGVAPDGFQAALWLRLAAKGDLPEAQYNLALAYEFGRGVGKDESQAQRWYRAAAAQGYAPARYNLALMLADGRGSPPDPAAAAALLRLAGLQGFTAAQNDYGVALAKGRGMAVPDPVAAYAWLSLAAENGALPHNRDVVGRKLTEAQRAQAKIQLGALRAEAGQAMTAATATPPAPAGAMSGVAVAAGEEPLAAARPDPERDRARNAGALGVLAGPAADAVLGPAPPFGRGELFSAGGTAELRAARAKIVDLQSSLAALRSQLAGWQRMADESGRLAAEQSDARGALADEKAALTRRLAAEEEAAAEQGKKLALLAAEKDKLAAAAAALARPAAPGPADSQGLDAANEKLEKQTRELAEANAAMTGQLKTLRLDNARLAALPQELESAESRARVARHDADQAQADLLAAQAKLAGNAAANSAPPRPAAAPPVPASFPPAAVPAAAPARVYVVVEGDSLSRISQKNYGTRGRWRDIFEANRDILANENSLQPGQRLKIPE